MPTIEDFIIPDGDVVVVSDDTIKKIDEEFSSECERIDRDAAIAEIESRNIILNQ